MDNKRPTGMLGFTIVWLGQVVSLLGTSMSQFAITLWAWEFVTVIEPSDDPASKFALVALFNFAPAVLFSPIAGVLVDRWNRKLVMMLSDLGAGAATIAIFLLFTSGNLRIEHLYIAGIVTGIFQSFQFPAYSAAISTMVPKAQYARADAMLGLAESGAQIAAPILAAILLGVIGLSGVLLIDIVTFTVAVGVLLFVHIPQPEQTEAGREGKGSMWTEIVYGFRYIFTRRSLLGMQLIFFWGNFLSSVSFAVFFPMILSRTGNDKDVVGLVQAAAGVGGVIGGVLLTAWGGPRRKARGVLMGWILSSALGGVLLGLGQVVWIWVVASFFNTFFIPLVNGSNQALWQAKVAPDVQGRVFATRRLIAQITGPLGIFLGGFLADRVFEPAMRVEGAWTGLFGGLVGTGPGAGMALMFVLASGITILVGVVGFMIPAIRDADSILPDHDTPAVVPQPSDGVEVAAAV